MTASQWRVMIAKTRKISTGDKYVPKLEELFQKIIEMDLWLFHKINRDWTNSYADYLFPSITDLHKNTFFIYIFLPWLLFVFIRQFAIRGVFAFIGLALTVGVSDFVGGNLIKPSFQRERPATAVESSIVRSKHANGYSFTSNHSSNSMAAAVYLGSWIPQGRVLFWVIGGLVSYSRIYNGVHYPSDVLVGMIIGILFGKILSALSLWIIVGKKPEPFFYRPPR